MRIRKRWIILVGLALLIALIMMPFLIVKANLERDLAVLASIDIEAIDFSQFKEGICEGEFRAMPVSARVRVTLSDGLIRNIARLEHSI